MSKLSLSDPSEENQLRKPKTRQFPLDFEAKKTISIYPEPTEAPISLGGNVLEIGPGRGDLLFALAQRCPSQKFIAIEIGNKRYKKLVERAQKRQLTNITLVRADARVALTRFFTPESFEKIFVLFPDPWPKDRHAFKRLLSVEWIRILVQLLKPGGQFIAATDVPWYAKWAFDNINTIKELRNTLHPHEFQASLPELPETYFQKKWKDMGLNLHFMQFEKTKTSTK